MSFLLSLFLLQTVAPLPIPKLPSPGDAVVRVSPQEVRTALARNDAVLVDVRGEVAYTLQHIRGAVSIPLGLVKQRASELPQDKLIVAYCTCKHDELSIQAALDLANAGFERTAVLEGGYKAWTDAGFPIDVAPPDPEAAPMPPPGQVSISSGGRIAPQTIVTCDRNQLTSYSGKVTMFRKTRSRTSIRIATDADTVETVTARAPKYLIFGEPMKAADWKRKGVGKGGRAIVWVCRAEGVQPVIDWRPGEQDGPGL